MPLRLASIKNARSGDKKAEFSDFRPLFIEPGLKRLFSAPRDANPVPKTRFSVNTTREKAEKSSPRPELSKSGPYCDFSAFSHPSREHRHDTRSVHLSRRRHHHATPFRRASREVHSARGLAAALGTARSSRPRRFSCKACIAAEKSAQGSRGPAPSAETRSSRPFSAT